MSPQYTPKALLEFWKKVSIAGPDECWEWIGWRDRNGYGMKSVDRKDYCAHRLSYEIANGPIPDGLFILHRCDNPPCVNPAHLVAGTQLENIRDRDTKKRNTRGQKHPKAKLTEIQVAEIKALHGTKSHRKIAQQYGISHTSVDYIINGKNWRCLNE